MKLKSFYMQGNSQSIGKTTHRIGRNLFQLHIWQRISIYDVQGSKKLNTRKQATQLKVGYGIEQRLLAELQVAEKHVCCVYHP